MKHNKFLATVLSAAMLMGMSACTFTVNNPNYQGDDSSDDYSYYYDSSETIEDISSDPVSSETEEGKEYGSDEVGWITLPGLIYNFHDPDTTDTCLQFAQSQYDIYSLDYFDTAVWSAQVGMEFDALTAASARYAALEEDKNAGTVEQLNAAQVKLGDYDAYQVYCYYPNDKQYLVMWYMDSPDKSKVYYLAAEFLETNMEFFNYSESYRMPDALKLQTPA